MSKSGYIKSNNTNIYYQVVGEGDPLVLLMGFGADSNAWEKHIKVYQDHFQCIVLDNRGVGSSDQPKGPYTTKMMATDTAAVMRKLGVEKAKVAGISMGGAIAQELVLHYPEKVSALVLTSTWAIFDKYAKTVYENLKKLRIVATPEDFMELLQLWIYAPPYFKAHLEDLKTAQQAAADEEIPQSQAGFEGQLDACIQHNTINRLHQIKVPTLITVGQMDIFTPPVFSTILHEKIEGSKLVKFAHGGHVHHWEELEKYNKVTLGFLLK